ncbi:MULTISPECIES: glucose-6-phosphate isomerase [Cryobacterium]|uniref:Glucose-6-phosphate isomerase n=1 Tax=Cryobacterium glucosi TaxID=1259175 RepID=A0ABY2ITH2_9MICO|nr:MULTISPECIES: glucose-6-phosphate isomerase [Cryobacterium]MDY7527834.1 glucose-6-phosphate isomerase [Cryobacterium sp. 10C2]MDY7556397.1 glucose-6-phosphate isomerase [Cryobacterium sp. 10C3]MEB0001444.1 glucose-6-phosphate isomerase [Cryobacterium sp. RTC2.1]MEB0202236.1 glucose-6-phosphate isomerase [Cryobacterium sp. 5I3]MEB0289659.1 glucose-6-phosphate isomerase [Cryobacterium sp. 10C2]
MSFRIAVTGAAADAARRTVPTLVSDLVASGITALDPALWGPEAESEAAKRLGWTESVAVSRPLVPEILALRATLASAGVTRIALAGMGGSSLAPEVITRTAGVALTVLDSTDPGQVLAALDDHLAETALVVSSKSGSTAETDSQCRVFERAFREAGIDPIGRIVVVTDPGSPLDTSARAAGYRVFNADPTVGGRFSVLTAFGLVPSGLAGVDIGELLDEAEAVSLALAVDSPENPGLILGAAIAATEPRRDKLALVADGTHIVGFPDWAEQLIAESTGKIGTGILPVVLELGAPELTENLPDLQVLRLVEDAGTTIFPADGTDEIRVSGTLGAQFLVWEYATVVAGRLLGINPFDQPDVEAAKVATRALLDGRPEPAPAAFISDGIEVRGTAHVIGAASDLASAIDALLEELGPDGYVSVQAYVNRLELPQLAGIRDLVAKLSKRPVTFGWGPRFLHSTGQLHKGGQPSGVFLQILATAQEDLSIPDRPFTFGELIQAQASGDASVLAQHGRPVLTLTLTDPAANIAALFGALK